MKKLQWEILRQSANKEWKHKQQQTPASEEINKNGAQREKELKLKSNQIKSFQQLMLINGNHQTECVCLSLICLATNWTHQYQCWQHCCYCCCSCWKRCACYVKVTDRSEQGAPLSQGAERFAALSLAQQMATRVAGAHPLLPQPTDRDVVVYVQPLNFPCIWGIICSSPQWFSCSFFL